MEQHLIDQFVKDQVDKWKRKDARERDMGQLAFSVITLCMEPGSGGKLIAEKVADKLGFDYFHQEVIKGIASNSRFGSAVVDSLEKERLTGVEDFISSLIKEKYMYPGTYLRLLMRVVATMARHGSSVIVKR